MVQTDPPRRLRILAIDDDAGDFEVLSRALEASPGLQCEIVNARTTRSAMQWLGDSCPPPFDLVFVDYYLDSMTGAEWIRQARARHRDVPIIALTARDDRSGVAEFMRAGADLFLSKADIYPAAIEAAIREAIDARDAGDPIALCEKNSTQDPPAASAGEADPKSAGK